jgi:hypothetical protein
MAFEFEWKVGNHAKVVERVINAEGTVAGSHFPALPEANAPRRKGEIPSGQALSTDQPPSDNKPLSPKAQVSFIGATP